LAAATQFSAFETASKEVAIEVLFSVESALGKSGCVNSKLISKLLNRRKSVLMKRMRLKNSALDFRLADINYNSECFGRQGSASAICSINRAFENCHLSFGGYNEPDLCELSSEERHYSCFVLPEHSWTCGREELKKETEFEQKAADLETGRYES
jgi:hypothetical protein